MSASTKTAVAIASGVLALGVGIGVASANFASADTPVTPTPSPTIAPPSDPIPTTPTPSDPPPGTEQPGWPSNPDQADQEAALIKVLSEMFGVDEAEVQGCPRRDAGGLPGGWRSGCGGRVSGPSGPVGHFDPGRGGYDPPGGRAGHDQPGSQVRPQLLVAVAHDLGKLRCSLVAEDVLQHHRFPTRPGERDSPVRIFVDGSRLVL